MKKNQILSFLLSSAMLVLTACSSDDKTQDQKPDETSKTTVQLLPTNNLGTVLTDNAGKTLYFFSIDANGQSSCKDGCLDAWPIFYTQDLKLPEGLAAADFGTITRADGQKQTTYKNWPLYYYKGDAAKGDTKGENIGGSWFVAKPDYIVMLAKTQLVGMDGISYNGTYTAGTAQTDYLVDPYGKTLYAFKFDHFNKNTYTKSDFSNNGTWPLYELNTAAGSVPSVFKNTDFEIITVFNKKQLSHKGWPLYYFGPDNALRGSTKGVSVPTPGVWPIVNANTVAAPQ